MQTDRQTETHIQTDTDRYRETDTDPHREKEPTIPRETEKRGEDRKSVLYESCRLSKR